MVIKIMTMMKITITVLFRGDDEDDGYDDEMMATEVEFVNAVSAGGSVKFLPAV